ncbi:PhzF family phenazine biosynthesis protein [Salinispora tropica]|uniref:Phenazine biosynthesis protein PhzF family n=1 Tax=Salinispora tropica (strain ATCC BAA-916 / DSM 44818 / JCM 13857 / NBRC 105044 / CNB-440) TaxID=369723 RepID=A4X3R7_SALTO|nr:PhzF family phenazine biosynthesis protein [Salinispora tropica]ABP53517.1 phenazine biosynthesis protein PhzF family [Salinispora tropica CNB-440]
MAGLRRRRFAQVDVFAEEAYLGNPVAVVLDGDGITERDMAQFARWTNLSETTYVLPSAVADYRLRIFTPGGEIPFAGHPTLGSAHAWLEAGGIPHSDVLVQECDLGLVTVRRAVTGLSFAAPPLRRDGPLASDHLARIVRALRIAPEQVVAHGWVDNGPGWAAVRLASADEVLAVDPDEQQMYDLMLGVVGAYPAGSPLQFEVRAFAAPAGVREDPVTGSLNAGIAQWLISTGAAPGSYRAGQGARVGRRGVLTVSADGDVVWVGGRSTTYVRGVVDL